MSASTRTGLVRGRPGPSRGTRIPPSTAPNWGCHPLPSGHHDRQGPLALLNRQVQLGGQPTPGASQPMVWRLDGDPAGFFALPVPLCGTGGVLMGAADGGVHADLPGDQPPRVGLGLQPGEDSLPGPIALPAPKQPIDGLPRPGVDRRDAHRGIVKFCGSKVLA